MGWRRRRHEVKTPDQFRSMRQAGLVVAEALRRCADECAPGITTADLDRIAREVLRRHGATSSFLGYFGYPAVICASVNDEVVHGIPGERVLAEGDLISIDFGAVVDGWHGDAAITVEVGECTPADRRLSEVTRQALWDGLAAARVGGRLGDISAAVEASVLGAGPDLAILDDYGGHGIGTSMHMDPFVPNRGREGQGARLVAGMALAIEPMVTLGSHRGRVLDDEWTVVTEDGSRAAHWEHTVALTADGPWVLTAEDGGAGEFADRGVASPAATLG